VILFAAANLQQFAIVINKSPGSASQAGFLTGLYIVFVPIFGLLLGRKSYPLMWVAAAFGFAGLALISIGPEGLSSLQVSDLLLVAGAVIWAVHILWIDHFAHSINPVGFAAVQFGVGAVLSMACAFVFETVKLQGLISGLWPLLFGGVIASGAAYTFQILGQRGVGPTKAAVIFSLEALFAAVSEVLWLGETMTAQKYIGGAVILAGILLSQVKPKAKA